MQDIPATGADGDKVRLLQDALLPELDEAEDKAWDSLARYKFQMFGYWAAIWVHLNRVGEFRRPNPWGGLVRLARMHGIEEALGQPVQTRNEQAVGDALYGPKSAS